MHHKLQLHGAFLLLIVSPFASAVVSGTKRDDRFSASRQHCLSLSATTVSHNVFFATFASHRPSS